MDTPTEDWIREVFDMPKKQPNAPGQRVPARENILLQGQATPDIAGIPASAANTGTAAASAGSADGTGGNKSGGPPAASQKGNVKITTGTGNVGKPPSAAS